MSTHKSRRCIQEYDWVALLHSRQSSELLSLGLNEAHRILTDDRMREQYDVTGSTHDRPAPRHNASYGHSHFARHAREDPFFFFFAEAARQQEAYYRQQRSRRML